MTFHSWLRLDYVGRRWHNFVSFDKRFSPFFFSKEGQLNIVISIDDNYAMKHQYLYFKFSPRFTEQPFSHLSAASTSLFRGQDGLLNGIPCLPRQRRSLKPLKAYKDYFFSFRYPVLAEKPEWWWRTLACVPYLIALQISHTGFYLQPFLEHYEFLGDLIYFIPGAITRLPDWFTIFYFYCCFAIVKNKDWPHFFRFHLIMSMLLETALQVVWYTSNFMPLIHFNGTFGMHYWAGVGFAYILILFQCVRCALAGGYAHIPIISDAAYIHTLFNMGGFQRPF